MSELRVQLGSRVEAAFMRGESTIIRHGSRNIARAVLVPYEVGPEPTPVTVSGETQSYLVSPEWFERAREALGEKGHPPTSGT